MKITTGLFSTASLIRFITSILIDLVLDKSQYTATLAASLSTDALGQNAGFYEVFVTVASTCVCSHCSSTAKCQSLLP